MAPKRLCKDGNICSDNEPATVNCAGSEHLHREKPGLCRVGAVAYRLPAFGKQCAFLSPDVDMPINGISPFYLPSNSRSASPAQSSTTAFFESSGDPSPSDGRLLAHVNALSRIQTTLPDGRSLSMFRFDLG